MRKSAQTITLALPLSWLICGCGLLVPSRHDPYAYKPIHAAAEAGDLSEVQRLVTSNPRLVQIKDWQNLTPLHLAVVHEHRDVAEFLIEKGGQVNARTSLGITPLHFAAQNGDKATVELLLSHKANLRALDKNGWTPADRAAKWGHADLAAFLRQLKLDP